MCQLETDERILREKAEAALAKYKVHAVVANALHTRYQHVDVYTPPGEEGSQCRRILHSEELGLEENLMAMLARMHLDKISRSAES